MSLKKVDVSKITRQKLQKKMLKIKIDSLEDDFLNMLIEELNFISLGKLFQMATARYKNFAGP